VAGCGLMGDLAAETTAGCRLMRPGVCRRWLPVWLPKIDGARQLRGHVVALVVCGVWTMATAQSRRSLPRRCWARITSDPASPTEQCNVMSSVFRRPGKRPVTTSPSEMRAPGSVKNGS
jgi:hypothetical protein